MTLQNLYLNILYCKNRSSYGGDHASRSFVKTQNHHELLFFAKGQGAIVLNQKRYPIRDGTLLYICPDVPHEIETIPGEPVTILAVHFNCISVSLADGVWAAAPEARKLPFSAVEQVADHHVIAELFGKLVQSWDEKLPGYEFVARTTLQELLLAVYAQTHKENKNFAIGSKIETIIHFMHENIQQQITLAEVSRLVQLSPAYLTRSFRDATGYAVISYFNRMKIDRAKELLSEGDGRVKDVAQALGFGDEFYFSRIFKKTVGISPAEYRRRNVHGV